MDKYVWISFGSENYLPTALIGFKGLIDEFVTIELKCIWIMGNK
jgi:hypothetical protein